MEDVSLKALDWLLEPDAQNPGVRFFTLVDLLERKEDDLEVCGARRAVMESGPVPVILAAQDAQGFWVEPGAGYAPKYRGTVWSVLFLAQFGADGTDPRVRAGGAYLLDHARSAYGGFSLDARPSLMVQCLQGNLCAALIALGWWGDERLTAAADWLARSITGEGVGSAEDKDSPRHYYRSGNGGPGFLCSGTNQKACGWAAVKAMLALGRVPEAERTPVMREAIRTGAEFLLGCDPATAGYPTAENTKPSQSWFQFGYPLGYVTDVLQILEALGGIGYGSDPRLANAIELVMRKQDAQGRWKMEYTYNGKTWADTEVKGQPSKWVTLRALRVIKRWKEGREGESSW